MDYGFCPGITPFDIKIADMLAARANTTLIKRSQAKNIEKFVDFLNTDTSVTRPVQDILLGAHGTAKGQLSVQFTDTKIQNIIWDKTPYNPVLLFADAQGLGKLATGTVQTGSNFHVKGCTIGQNKPYVDRLKKILGGNVTLTAPKLFQQITRLRVNNTDVGFIEALGHDFFVTSTAEIKTRAKMIAAFQAKQLDFFNGTKVPNNLWKKWLPANVTQGEREAKFNLVLKPAIKFNASTVIGKLNVKDDIGFTYRKETTPIFTNMNWTGTTLPTGNSAIITFLEPQMQADKDYDPTKTDFPIYMIYGFSNVTDYLNDWTWTVVNPRQKVLQAYGERYFARIIVPACKTSGKFNELLYNFYPLPGAVQTALTGISQTDPQFYLIV